MPKIRIEDILRPNKDGTFTLNELKYSPEEQAQKIKEIEKIREKIRKRTHVDWDELSKFVITL